MPRAGSIMLYSRGVKHTYTTHNIFILKITKSRDAAVKKNRYKRSRDK